ncbi:MAG: NAD-dependent dehydratase [Phycisphaerae bacterium]|nr:NAD-dependent dehydratase [Phycisphaerae bacterium]
MKVLLTGGSGFLGSQLCEELLGAGHEVVVLDDHSRGRPARLERFGDRVQLVDGDVRDLDAVRAATEGCEVVWHLAYINGTRYFYEKPDMVLEVGVKGTLNTIEAALDCGVRRYVLASTSETYNNPTHVPTTESERLMIPDVTNPRFSYGGGKIACELLTLHYGGFRGLETVLFRPHNFIGPDMGFEHVIPEITGRIFEMSNGLELKEIDLPIQGDGSETRSFCDITDGARGAFLSGEHGENGNIYHVGTEEEVSIRTLVETIGDVMGVKINVVPGELRAGGTPRRCPSVEKLRGLGYEPKYSFRQAVERCVGWYVDYHMAKRKADA